MNRCVEPEWLDELPAQDASASRSRQDLRRVNWCMAHASILSRELRSLGPLSAGMQFVDLGGGDGTFLLSLAQRLGSDWSGTHAIILDLRELVSPTTLNQFSRLGWKVRSVRANALGWFGDPSGICDRKAIVLANLFLHHFDDRELTSLLRAIGRSAAALVALEPRRGRFPLIFSQLVWMIGCNRVTRHDAPASVRAGFRNHELGRLWLDRAGWDLLEREAGLFSHLFVARRAREFQ